jgi:hypothetical protein
MLAMVFLIPAVFGWAVWRSYRSAGARAARGEPLAPPGTIRWERSGEDERAP